MKITHARKYLAVLMTFALLLTCLAIGLTASAVEAKVYTIGNPYQNVIWSGDNAWGQHKTQLHVHSSSSDGDLSIAELVEEHYRLGYDAMAITDHATVGVPWNRLPRMAPYMRVMQLINSNASSPAALSDVRRQQVLDGYQRGGRGMMEVTGAIELKGVAESHVNSFFADPVWGQGLLGINRDYNTPLRETGKANGVNFINHIGRVTGADDVSIEEAREMYAIDSFWVNRYARLFLDHDNLLGIEINSKSDTETRNDRILYDNLLQVLVPHGRVPWMFSTSDAHRNGEFDRGWSVFLMPEPSPENLRTSMETGAFFGVNRYARNEFGDSVTRTGAVPQVNRITVNETAGTIAVDASNFNTIAWVADGEIILEGEDALVLDLAEYEEDISVYVRAYLLGDGGILYIQPFTIACTCFCYMPPAEIPVTRDYSDYLRFFYDLLVAPLLKYTPLGWIAYLLISFDPAYDLPWLVNLFG